MVTTTRRGFLGGVAAGALTTMSPRLSFAIGRGSFNDEILIYIFLRGGIDGLSVYAPGSGHPDRGFYENLRPSTSVRLPTGTMLPLADGFGINAAGAPLIDLWNEGDFAIVHATGLPIVNRSHFEAQRLIELGTPGAVVGVNDNETIPGTRLTSDGWLTRHLASAGNLPPQMLMPVVVTENQVTFSLLREPSAVTLRFPDRFDFNESNLEEEVEQALEDIYALDSSSAGVAGEQAFNALNQLEPIFGAQSNNDYNANALNNLYPVRNDGRPETFSDKLITLSRLIKAGVDLRIGQIDVGGWDDHVDQGSVPSGVNNSSGRFYERFDIVARALNAFWTDMAGGADDSTDRRSKVTVVLHSEFGRRAFNNNDNGTDHGSGNPMMLLGGNVNGGRFHGQWPGMSPSQLFQNADVRSTTDFRRILSEVLIRRQGNNALGTVFPFYYNYQPIGVVQGVDQRPDYGPDDLIQSDSFE
ncbi:MAG TPA: DUF1501 domain-containing protein [Wenzhouxiangellaceae bacterium]|nr:DUF1501 domain-containing protein [Wenzhouxiangellaceae bacterium]